MFPDIAAERLSQHHIQNIAWSSVHGEDKGLTGEMIMDALQIHGKPHDLLK